MKQVQLQVLTFGIAKDIIGKQLLELDIPENSTVESLRKKLYHQFPDLERLKSLSIAVNNEYAENDLMLNTSDEVALIPPVSGG